MLRSAPRRTALLTVGKRRFSTPCAEQKADTESSLSGIDFGVNVLGWLPYGTEPRFASFQEETVNNPASAIDHELLAQYKTVCAEKIKDTAYTLNEMLSLKLYTDTTHY